MLLKLSTSTDKARIGTVREGSPGGGFAGTRQTPQSFGGLPRWDTNALEAASMVAVTANQAGGGLAESHCPVTKHGPPASCLPCRLRPSTPLLCCRNPPDGGKQIVLGPVSHFRQLVGDEAEHSSHVDRREGVLDAVDLRPVMPRRVLLNVGELAMVGVHNP